MDCVCKSQPEMECKICGRLPLFSGAYYCTNCKNSDPDNITISKDDMGDEYEWTCNHCGAVYRGNPLAVVYDPTPVKRRHKRGTAKSYRRKSHLVERISGHYAVDPAIPEENRTLIRNEFTALGIKSPYTKSHVAEVLRSLNKKAPVGKKNRYFALRYLEKHKQIIKMMEPDAQKLKFLTPDQTGQVGALFLFMSHKWDERQNKEMANERKFPERKHFPNFNQTFMRIFDILQIPIENYDPLEFPLPTTLSSRNRVSKYIDALVEEAKNKKMIVEKK